MTGALLAILIGLAGDAAPGAPQPGAAPGTAATGATATGSPRCPDAETVRSALRTLGTREDPERIADAAARAGLEVEDLGDSVRVRIGSVQRDYPDAARDCERRARLVAVVAALVVAPEGPDGPLSEVALPAPAPATPQQPIIVAVALAPAPPASPRARFEIGAGPTFALAPHRGSAEATAGVAIAIARIYTRWSFGMALTVPVLPADASIGGTAIRLDRFPLRLVVGNRLDLGVLRAAVEAGAVVSLLRVARTGPPPAVAVTRLEPGAHLGAELSFPTRRVSFYLAVSSDWIPRTYPIALDPEGEVDRTPALWLAGEAGLRFALH